MLGKRILKESLNVSPEIMARAQTVVNEMWKKVTGMPFDLDVIAAPVQRDPITGDIVKVPYLDNGTKILTTVANMCAEKLLAGIAGANVIETYGYGRDVIGTIPVKARLVNAIDYSYVSHNPHVNINLDASKISDRFCLDQENLAKVSASNQAKQDALTFLAALKILCVVSSAISNYGNEKTADLRRHQKEEQKAAAKAAGVEKRRLAKLAKEKEEADKIAAMSDEERAAYLDAKAKAALEKTLGRVRNNAIKRVDELKDASAIVTSQINAVSVDDWLKEHVIGIRFEYPNINDLPDDMPDKDKERLNRFYDELKIGYPQIVNSPKHFVLVTRKPEKDPKNYSFWGLGGKIRFDIEFKYFPDIVKDLVIKSVEESQKNHHNALMPKDIDKEFTNVYLCFAIISLYGYDVDFYNKASSDNGLYDDEDETLGISDIDIDNALNLDFSDAPDDDGLDESFEEEDLLDDPFLSEYESDLFDVDELEKAQAEVDALHADDSLEEDISDNGVAGNIMKIAQNYKKAFKK